MKWDGPVGRLFFAREVLTTWYGLKRAIWYAVGHLLKRLISNIVG